MDEFAQTRGGDDLFDDEIIPVTAEQQQQEQQSLQTEDLHDYQQSFEESITTTTAGYENDLSPQGRTEIPTRPRGAERRGRGRGRGGRGGRRGSQNTGRRGDANVRINHNNHQRSAEGPGEGAGEEGENKSPVEETAAAERETEQQAGEKPAEGPRVPAVRGDRSATGGIKKPKLTEEELSRRIAAAKENAAKVAAAHARAEADQASFLEREKVAEEKRRQERAQRKVMDNERERNRQRKLQAFAGREWDAQKTEEDFNPRGGRGGFRRGMHGGVSGYTRRDFEGQAADQPAGEPSEESRAESPRGGHRGRGRGGRGGRGRGGHRGPREDIPQTDGPAENVPGLSESRWAPAPVLDNEADFPALPGSEKNAKDASKEGPKDWVKDDRKDTVKKAPKESKESKDTQESKEPANAAASAANLDLLAVDPLSPMEGTSWAEQVESQ
ncbi:uncharacterized protein BO97DRAFT_5106 [Aspergillus homomorphus CBS 101889]|uniref:Uncharacterized protein n=1 Tax=Aspergillus homomorphus (strain CBS 101889) TaxID=1450537 RepID=A0A395IBF4_ASPHC|nr:hypothetical protein BO97DRAFT_5106 [Aspergillus homomorphus CBS 101889]RAL17351.1 hypothetical protein BO97DRAFT_5106 [Aspergillus homomorphus CBS 101889]